MPPKDTQLSEVSGAPNLSDYGLITSRKSRIGAGVSSYEYTDAYNQARMAQYNNDYNFWLWMQQAEYNSPSNQVARLKAAGLNPNFNSIDGTGNLGSMPTSSGAISPSIGRNRASMQQVTVNSILGAVNSTLKAFDEGVDMIGKVKDLPPLSRLKEYRDLVVQQAYRNLHGKELQNFLTLVDGLYKAEFAGVDTSGIKEIGLNLPGIASQYSGPGGYDPEYGLGYQSIKAKLAVWDQQLKNMGLDYDIKEVVKRCKSYYADNMQSIEREILNAKSGMMSTGGVIKKIANGDFQDLSFWQVIAAIVATAAQR